ncbi:aldo/keto reductase [Candidatus Poribacteria bacterium]|nr:aldo/keto reductase [Candidatus Poribacteria bacterium]
MADTFVGKAVPTDRSHTEVKKLPHRILGRTGVSVSALGFGAAPLGISRADATFFERTLHEAIDLGINYIDVAPAYGDGEEKLGPVIKERRDEVFLVTKTLLREPRTQDEALRQLNESLKKLQTDCLDLVHLHNVGNFTPEESLGPNGGLKGLLQAKQEGLLRFIGISGHVKPLKFIPLLETGEVDVVMPALNFVDGHTYGFESKVLPLARKHNCGIVAMKVLGGPTGGLGAYNPPQPALLSGAHYTNAIRYALSIPDVACAVIGLKDTNELLQAVEAVTNFSPLSEAEQAALEAEGKKLAAEWGAHFGPVE